MHIKQFSEQEQAKFKTEHDLAQPKHWAVMDGSIVYQFYNTEVEAKVGLAQADLAGAIYDDFLEWIDNKALQYGISTEEIKEIIC